jgi:hypothetical protein
MTPASHGAVHALAADHGERPSDIVCGPAAHDRCWSNVVEARDLRLTDALVVGAVREQDLALDPGKQRTEVGWRQCFERLIHPAPEGHARLVSWQAPGKEPDVVLGDERA